MRYAGPMGNRTFVGGAAVFAAWMCLVGCGDDTNSPTSGPSASSSGGAGGAGAGGGAMGGMAAAGGGGGEGGGDTNVFTVLLETTAGEVVLEVHRDWAPVGAEHFHELVDAGFYDNCAFFRVVPGFIAQWGLNGDPAVNAQWTSMNIADDPVVESNLVGMVTYAQTSQPNSRSTQLFINYDDNSFLDGQGFAPFARVISGMAAFEAINAEYGEQPSQSQIGSQGDAYLDANFPNLDKITKATIQ